MNERQIEEQLSFLYGPTTSTLRWTILSRVCFVSSAMVACSVRLVRFRKLDSSKPDTGCDAEVFPLCKDEATEERLQAFADQEQKCTVKIMVKMPLKCGMCLLIRCYSVSTSQFEVLDLLQQYRTKSPL